MASHTPISYRPDIDGLRAVAIATVVVYHAFPSWLQGGFVGVDVFFVISGYLISTILIKDLSAGRFGFAAFYARRAKRLLPALFLVLATAAIAGWLFMLPADYKLLGKHIAGSAAFLQNIVLWTESGYFNKASGLKPLLHLWSLGIEEQFYLLYPICLWLLWPRPRAILPALLGIAGLSFYLNVDRIGTHPSEVFFLPHTRFWELLVGGLLAYWQHVRGRDRYPNRYLASMVSAVGAALIIGAAFTLVSDMQFPGWLAVIPVAGAAMILYGGPNAAINRMILSRKALVATGKISYPLYLWHWPLLSFPGVLGIELGLSDRVGLVLLALVLSWLTCRYIEGPIRFGHFRRPIIMRSAAFATSAALAVGLGIFALGGVPSRLPASVQSLATYNYQFHDSARYRQCWLSAEDEPLGFAETCFATLRNAPERTVLLWGDSHAARLYAGIAEHFDGAANVAQLTRDSCPPLAGFSPRKPNCDAGNQQIMDLTRQHTPGTVVLFAAWRNYSTDWSDGAKSSESLLRTIGQLQRNGVRQIFVIGPSPRWNGDLPSLLLQAAKPDLGSYTVPKRLGTMLDQAAFQVDKQMGDLLARIGTPYHSAIHSFCAAGECLVRVSESGDDLTTWDYGHLTTSGAVHLAKDFSPDLQRAFAQ